MSRTSHRDGTSKSDLRADTGQGNLYPHGRSHFLATEPLGDNLGHGNTCHFGTHAKDSITGRSHHHTRTEAENLTGIFCQDRQSVVFQSCTQYHQDSRQLTCKADTETVENQTTPKEHQQEYIQETISSGVCTELCTAPSQFGFEHRLERHHYIVHEVGRHHGKGNHRQRSPAHSGRIVQSFFFHCSSHLLGYPPPCEGG